MVTWYDGAVTQEGEETMRWKIAAAASAVVLAGAGGGIAATLSGSNPSHPIQVVNSGATGSTTTSTVPSTTVAPATTVAPLTTTVPATTTAPVAVPDVVGDVVGVAESTVTSAGLQYSLTGNGTIVMAQSPPPGQKVADGATVSLALGTGHI